MRGKNKKYIEVKRIKCIACGHEIYECEECRKEFKDGDDIICFGGKSHFCSKKCLNNYIYDMTVKSYARSEQKIEYLW